MWWHNPGLHSILHWALCPTNVASDLTEILVALFPCTNIITSLCPAGIPCSIDVSTCFSQSYLCVCWYQYHMVHISLCRGEYGRSGTDVQYRVPRLSGPLISVYQYTVQVGGGPLCALRDNPRLCWHPSPPGRDMLVVTLSIKQLFSQVLMQVLLSDLCLLTPATLSPWSEVLSAATSFRAKQRHSGRYCGGSSPESSEVQSPAAGAERHLR